MERSADVLDDQLELITAFRQDLERLGMPTAHQDDAERLLAKTRSAEEELGRAIDALREGDGEKATAALQRYFGFSQ